MDTTYIQNNIRFNNDIFFKHCLAGKDEASKSLRQAIIEELIPIQCREVKVINPEITAMALQGKGVRLDILLEDVKTKELINIEMQVSKYKINEAKRFQYYGSRLLVNQMPTGTAYEELVKVYQIIFIDDCLENDKFINCYQSKNQDSEVEIENLITRIYVHLPIIDRLVEEKGMEELSDFEKMCYLFKNNKNDAILKVIKEGMAKILMDKYEEFPTHTTLWSWAQAIEDGENTINARLRVEYNEGFEKGQEDGIEEGIEEGKREGMKQGALETVIKMIDRKYQVNARIWVYTLSNEQIEEILDILFEIDEFNTLKEMIENTKINGS